MSGRHSELHWEYRRRASKVAAIVNAMADVQSMLVEAHTAAQFVLSDQGSGSTERVSGGDTSRPTEAAFAQRFWARSKLDEVDAILERLLSTPGVAERTGELDVLRHRLTQLAAAGMERDKADVEPRSNLTDCLACERVILGTAEDPVRKGYCNACDVAWRRYQDRWEGPGGPDRAVFERTRRGKGAEQARVDPTRSLVSSVTVDGVDVQLSDTESAGLLVDGVVCPEAMADLVERIRSGTR